MTTTDGGRRDGGAAPEGDLPRDETRDLFGERAQRPMRQGELPGIASHAEAQTPPRTEGGQVWDPMTIDLFEEEER